MPEHPAAPTIPGLRFIRKLGAGGYADVYLYEQALPQREGVVHGAPLSATRALYQFMKPEIARLSTR